MASLTQWTWVGASSGRSWRTEKAGVLQSMGSQSWTWLSDWTTTTIVTWLNKYCFIVTYDPIWPRVLSFFPFLKSIDLFTYLFVVALSPHYSLWTSSSCGEEQPPSGCGARASRCGSFSYCGVWALGAWVSVVVSHGLGCLSACGIFPDKGMNPCPPNWEVDS